MCKHYLMENFDDTLERKLGNWYLALLAVMCSIYWIVVVVLQATAYRDTIMIVGAMVVAPAMLAARFSSGRNLAGNRMTKSIGQSNM